MTRAWESHPGCSLEFGWKGVRTAVRTQSAGQELVRGRGAEEGHLPGRLSRTLPHDREDEGMRETEENCSAMT